MSQEPDQAGHGQIISGRPQKTNIIFLLLRRADWTDNPKLPPANVSCSIHRKQRCPRLYLNVWSPGHGEDFLILAAGKHTDLLIIQIIWTLRIKRTGNRTGAWLHISFCKTLRSRPASENTTETELCSCY